MNVKINFSVPFEQVPANVQKFVRATNTDLVNIEETLQDFEISSVGEGLAKIDSIRRQLAHVDMFLRDCYSILQAYENHLDGEPISEKEEGEDNAG
jgi:hypothetical protein